ncbi:hypothetical protein AB0C06_25760 [Micromonospora inaquosa]|uniref:Uncharacterized protein n=1 Tax=Micromonospora inaquosa TaxID=2203716 RepID=A0A3N9WII5_9ACTN|nr:hypothetical protein [Micromonospora inaquosa]RQX00459.1 hypothetical protein DLJ59_21370 [Micromonospora inaquosa]
MGDLLAGLHAARIDADRAAALAARVRWRLSATEDRLRRTREVADVVAARHFAAAIHPIGPGRCPARGRRLPDRAFGGGTDRPVVAAPTDHSMAAPTDRSVAALDGEPAAPPRHASHDSAADHDSVNDRASVAGSAEVIACGCQAASALVTRRGRLTGPRAHRRALTMVRERRW